MAGTQRPESTTRLKWYAASYNRSTTNSNSKQSNRKVAHLRAERGKCRLELRGILGLERLLDLDGQRCEDLEGVNSAGAQAGLRMSWR